MMLYLIFYYLFFQAEFLLTSKERLHLKRALQQYELNRYGLISALRLFIYFLVVRLLLIFSGSTSF